MSYSIAAPLRSSQAARVRAFMRRNYRPLSRLYGLDPAEPEWLDPPTTRLHYSSKTGRWNLFGFNYQSITPPGWRSYAYVLVRWMAVVAGTRRMTPDHGSLPFYYHDRERIPLSVTHSLEELLSSSSNEPPVPVDELGFRRPKEVTAAEFELFFPEEAARWPGVVRTEMERLNLLWTQR